MQEAIAIVDSGLESLDLIKIKIEGIRDDAQHRFPKRMFNKREDEIRCHTMAVDQALDIVNSLEARFITGQSDAEPRGRRSTGLVYQDDESLFK